MKFVCRRCDGFMKFEEVESLSEGSLGVTFACAACGSRVSMVTNPGETQMVQALGVELGGRKSAPEPLELTRRTLAPSGATSAQRPSPPAKPDVAALSEGDPRPPRGFSEAARGAVSEAGARSPERSEGEDVRPATRESASTQSRVQGAAEQSLKDSMGKCPFSNMVAELAGKMAASASDSPSREREVHWTAEAAGRLERVPELVRGFARSAIEALAREKGSYVVDGALMDAAKEKFM